MNENGFMKKIVRPSSASVQFDDKANGQYIGQFQLQMPGANKILGVITYQS